MNDSWDDELSEEEVEKLLDKAEAEVRKRRLETPAIMALELHKPLSNVGANALVVIAPFVVPFFGYDNVQGVSRLLRNKANIEKLIQRLESPQATNSPRKL